MIRPHMSAAELSGAPAVPNILIATLDRPASLDLRNRLVTLHNLAGIVPFGELHAFIDLTGNAHFASPMDKIDEPPYKEVIISNTSPDDQDAITITWQVSPYDTEKGFLRKTGQYVFNPYKGTLLYSFTTGLWGDNKHGVHPQLEPVVSGGEIATPEAEAKFKEFQNLIKDIESQKGVERESTNYPTSKPLVLLV